MISYAVFDGTNRIHGLSESEAFTKYNKLISTHQDLIANVKASKIAKKAESEADFRAAGLVSEIPVAYVYTVHNYTIGKDIATVFTGQIKGRVALIKTVDGVVTEKYLQGAMIKGQVMDFVTYDSNGEPYEYYKTENRVCTKYLAATDEVVVTTQMFAVPTEKLKNSKFELGEIFGWSEKKTGLILEYVKAVDKESKAYTEAFALAYAQAFDEAKARFSITKVSVDANGNETWS